jgi:hypothetical protein
LKGKPLRVPSAKACGHSVRTHRRSQEQLIALARSWLDRAVHPVVCGSPDADGLYPNAKTAQRMWSEMAEANG